MPTTFVKGDFMAETPLLEGARVFAFAADVSGAMDRGVAVAVRKRWPALAEWWGAHGGKPRIDAGTMAKWNGGPDVVYALATERTGARPKLSWLENAVRAMLSDAAKSGHERISLARPWGGPGGLDGARAKRVLEGIGATSTVSLVVFEQFIRAKDAAHASPDTDADADADAVDAAAPEEEPGAPAKKRAKTAAQKKPKKAVTKKTSATKKSPKKTAKKKTVAAAKKKTARKSASR